MSLPIRLHPQKATYLDASEWPTVDFQGHWMPGSGPGPYDPKALMPGMGHTHLTCPLPLWAVVTPDTTLTIHFTHKLYEVDGSVVFIEGTFMDAGGQLPVPVTPSQWPIVGNPTGLVQTPCSVTFDFGVAYRAGIGLPDKGWIIPRIWTRTVFNNHDMLTLQALFPFYFVADPNAEERELNEAGINLAAKTDVMNQVDRNIAVFNSHLVEFRDRLPILAQIDVPQRTRVWGYNYGGDANWPAGHEKYDLTYQPDIHNYVPGELIPTTVEIGTGGNLDLWLPQHLANLPNLAGQDDHHRRLAFTWQKDTGMGFTDVHGGIVPGMCDLRSLITLTAIVDKATADDSKPFVEWAGSGPEKSPFPPPPDFQPTPTPTPEPEPTPAPTSETCTLTVQCTHEEHADGSCILHVTGGTAVCDGQTMTVLPCDVPCQE